MEHRAFGAPRLGVEYRNRPAVYGIAFDGADNAAVVFCEGYTTMRLTGEPVHPIQRVYLIELGERVAQPLEG